MLVQAGGRGNSLRCSRLKVHPPQQVLEATVVAEGVVVRLRTDINQCAVTLLESPLEPFKRETSRCRKSRGHSMNPDGDMYY